MDKLPVPLAGWAPGARVMIVRVDARRQVCVDGCRLMLGRVRSLGRCVMTEWGPAWTIESGADLVRPDPKKRPYWLVSWLQSELILLPSVAHVAAHDQLSDVGTTGPAERGGIR